jgi:AcrR family transcriptional regulator
VPSAKRTSPPSHKQLLTDLRRQEILAAAIKVFGKEGFADACVDDIAVAAKIAKGTLYLYFKSKEEIYAAAIHLAVDQLQVLSAEKLRSITGVRNRLTAAISIRMEFWKDQQELYRLLLTVGREPRHRRQTNQLTGSGQAHFLAILKEGAAAGELKKPCGAKSLDALAWAILDMVRGCNERRLDNVSRTTPAEDAASIAAMALDRLGL